MQCVYVHYARTGTYSSIVAMSDIDVTKDNSAVGI